jgi:hypothetical protein
MAKNDDARPPRQAAPGTVKVEAVRATRGQPATSVTVEVGAEKLREQAGQLRGSPEVLAQVPSVAGDRVEWREEPVPKMDEQEREGGRAIRYGTTYYGAAEVEQHGVGVKVKTEERVFTLKPTSEAVEVHEADKEPPRH